MSEESVRPQEEWLRPFGQDTEEDKQKEEHSEDEEEHRAMRPVI